MRLIRKYFYKSWILGTFLCLLMSIYFNNETLANNLCTFASQPCMYVVIGIMLFYCYNKQHFTQNVYSSTSNIYVVIFFIFLFLNGALDSIFSNGYFLTMMNIVAALLISRMIRFRDFSLWYIDIMAFLGVCSLLITYPLSPIIHSLPFPHVVNSAEIPFTNVYLCYLVDADFYIRNTGIFREAGVWGGFLVIALMIAIEKSLLYSPQKYWLRIFILVATIVSTFSTACLVAMIMIFLIMLVKRKNGNQKRISNIGLLVVAALVIFITLKLEAGAESLTESIDKLSGNTSSMDYRTEVMKNSIPVILSHPFGCGILNGTKMLSTLNTLKEYHNTSTFVAGALYFGWLYIAMYVAGIFLFCKRRLGSWLYMLPFAMLLNAEQYIFNPIFYLIIFYGLQKREQDNLVPIYN